MRHWRGILGLRSTWTGDDRRIDELTWRELPLTLRYQREDNGGHSNAIPCGTIDRVWFEGDELWGEGVFSDSEDGNYAAQVVGDQSLRGVSMDPGIVVAYDIILAADGTEVDIDEWYSYPAGEEPWPAPFKWATIYSQYEMAAATLVATPAFAEASIALVTDTEEERIAASTAAPDTGAHRMVSRHTQPAFKPHVSTSPTAVAMSEARQRLVASSAFRPPAGAFAQRDLGGYTRFSIDPDTGWISGHVYPWEGRHRGFTSTWVRPPQSRDFSQFLTGGQVTLDDGQAIDIGIITHFGGHLNTLAEYERAKEDPANQLGPVAIYADDHGVQVCGIAWPDIDPVALARAAASYPSGDWSVFGGEQKLSGIALVNNPGFHAYDQEGVEVRRLVASWRGSLDAKPAAPMNARSLADLAELDRWAENALR